MQIGYVELDLIEDVSACGTAASSCPRASAGECESTPEENLRTFYDGCTRLQQLYLAQNVQVATDNPKSFSNDKARLARRCEAHQSAGPAFFATADPMGYSQLRSVISSKYNCLQHMRCLADKERLCTERSKSTLAYLVPGAVSGSPHATPVAYVPVEVVKTLFTFLYTCCCLVALVMKPLQRMSSSLLYITCVSLLCYN